MHTPQNFPKDRHYRSLSSWLTHLRIVADLPYPGWALMPTLMTMAKDHVDGGAFSFMWFDPVAERPAALWIEPVSDAAYRGFLAGQRDIFDEYPVRLMIETRGRAIRALENTPEYEAGPMYQHVLRPLGVFWGMGVPVALGDGSIGFASACRPRDRGAYAESEWATWERFADCLGNLDRKGNRWANLPPAAVAETDSSTLWLARDGRLLTHGPSLRKLLFLLQGKPLGPPTWSRCDREALPGEVLAIAERMHDPDAPARMEMELERDSGRFHFIIERLQATPEMPSAPIGIGIRHFEPIDLAAARRLWGWPMSPQEKRILLATARNASLQQTAEVLGIGIGTLKGYINALLERFGADTRDALLERVLAVRPEGCARSEAAASRPH